MARALLLASLAELRMRPLRALIVVVAIALGVALVTGVRLVNGAVVSHFAASVRAVAGPVAFQVVAEHGEGRLRAAVADRLIGEPGIDVAMPVIDTNLPRIDADGYLRLFGLDVTDPAIRAAYGVDLDEDTDELAMLSRPRAALLPAGARPTHPRGSKLRVLAPTGPVTLEVVGHATPSRAVEAAGRNLAVVDFSVAQELLGLGDLVDRIDVIATDGVALEPLRERVQELVGEDLDVVTPAGRGTHFEASVRSFQLTIEALGLLALITALFIVYSTVSTTVVSRTRALATLRAVGVTKSGVTVLVAAEAAALGAIGSVLGAAVGAVLARHLSDLLRMTMEMVTLRPFGTTVRHFDAAELALAVVLGTLASVAAALPPALRAASADTADAIADRQPTASRSRNRVAPYLLAGLLLGATVAVAIALEVRWSSVWFGNLASTAWFVTIIVFAVPATAWLAAALRAPLSRLGPSGRIATNNLLATARHSAVAVSALALALATQITFSGLMGSLEESLVDYIEGFVACELIVSATRSQGGWLEQPIAKEVASKVAAVEGVAAASTIRLVPNQRVGDHPAALLVADHHAFAPWRYRRWLIRGDLEPALARVRAGEAVLVSQTLELIADVGLGDEVTLRSPTGPLTLPVVGVVIDHTSDLGSVIFDVETYRRHWLDDRVSRIHVSVTEGADVDAVRRRIAAALADPVGLKVASMAELLDYHRRMMREAFAPARVIEVMVLLVAFAGILESVVAGLSVRRRELALMRAAGATVRQVQGTILAEAAVVIAVGLVVGVLGGLASSWMWVSYHFTYLFGWVAEYHFAATETLRAAALAACVALFAAYLPARAAARADVLSGVHVD